MSTYPPDIEAYIEQKVASGQFRSRDEFAAEAARLYREMEVRRASLKADIAAAIDESERGLSAPLDIEAIKAELVDEIGPDGLPK